MRKLSLFIIAASAMLAVSATQADDTTDSGVTSDPSAVPVDAVPAPAPDDNTGAVIDPVVVVDPPIEVTDTADSSGDTGEATEASEDNGTTDNPGAPDDTGLITDTGMVDGSGSSEETGSTDDEKVTEEPVLMYTTSGRPEDCMECRTLTGTAGPAAVEPPAPEVTADVIDGNATGVDVMDPVDSKKRK